LLTSKIINKNNFDSPRDIQKFVSYKPIKATSCGFWNIERVNQDRTILTKIPHLLWKMRLIIQKVLLLGPIQSQLS